MQPQRVSRDERGAMAIEFLLVIGMLVVIFMLMLQYAVKMHAQRVASAAADEGLIAAASYDGSATAGEHVARSYLASIGPGLNTESVVATRDGATASVTVTGRVDQLIPFLALEVNVHVEGPVEHFVTATPSNP